MMTYFKYDTCKLQKQTGADDPASCEVTLRSRKMETRGTKRSLEEEGDVTSKNDSNSFESMLASLANQSCEDSGGSEAEDEDSLNPEVHEHHSSSESENEYDVKLMPEYKDEFPAIFRKDLYKWQRKYPYKMFKYNTVAPINSLNLTDDDLRDPYSLWKKYMEDEMLQDIITWTNMKLHEYRQKFAEENRPELEPLDIIELNGFIGLLLYTSYFKHNYWEIDEIFTTGILGMPLFYCSMSKIRFQIILCCLRFDNPSDRVERKTSDKATSISHLFTRFVNNCQKVYNVTEHVMVDDMLIHFHGRSKFMVVLPEKPSKRWLKLMCLCDVKNGYFYNSYIYTGPESHGQGLTDEERKLLVPTQSVIQLAKPLHGSDRNITCNSWFMSRELASELKMRGLTCVGSLNIDKNRSDIPEEFLPADDDDRKKRSSVYQYSDQSTLTSYVSKSNGDILILSTLPQREAVEGSIRFPGIVRFYNSSKIIVNLIDQKCFDHSCARKTRRSSMAIFYRILDISIMNSHILYDTRNQKKSDRAKFIKKVARALLKPHLARRLYNEQLSHDMRVSLVNILGSDCPDPGERCYLCCSSVAQSQCGSCTKIVCSDCSETICTHCMCGDGEED